MVFASRSKRARRSGVGRKCLGQHFERYVPVELRVAGLIHLTHAAFADLGGDVVVAEAGAYGQGHGLLGPRIRDILRRSGPRLHRRAQKCPEGAHSPRHGTT